MMDSLNWEYRCSFCEKGDDPEQIFRILRFWVGQVDGGLSGADIEAMERYMDFCCIEEMKFVPWEDLIMFPAGFDELEEHILHLCKVMKQLGWSHTVILER